jgi:uncharacterized membrane protein YozB (DUF420 family)
VALPGAYTPASIALHDKAVVLQGLLAFFNINFKTFFVKKKQKEIHVKEVNVAVTLRLVFLRCLVQNSAETSALLRLFLVFSVL